MLDVQSRHGLLSELGYMGSREGDRLIRVREPVRQPSREPSQALLSVGLPELMVTKYSFTSHESGYAYAWLEGRAPLPLPASQLRTKRLTNKIPEPISEGWPNYRPGKKGKGKDIVGCVIDLTQCFGDDFMDFSQYENGKGHEVRVNAQDILKRVAFEYPQCGDCVITSLLGRSGGSGFDAFLPETIVSDSDWRSEGGSSFLGEGLERNEI